MPDSGLIALFLRHKVAANLLMIAMIVAGYWSLLQMNVQFLPSFHIDIITVNIQWSGASAKDVENSLINPIERELRTLDDLKKINSTARYGHASFVLEFFEGSDMAKANESVRERVNRVRNLPTLAEKPIITRIEPYESISRLLIYGPEHLDELRDVSYQFERELLDRGIGKIEIIGLPQKEIRIEVKPQTLVSYKLSFLKLAQLIKTQSKDISAGKIAKMSTAHQLRSIEQKREVLGFEQMPLLSNKQGRLIRLGEIAQISSAADEEEVRLFYQGKPAVELRLLRSESKNSLKSAETVHRWVAEKRRILGQSIQIKIFDEKWELIEQRIDLLLSNGFTGLVFVVIILFIMLNSRVAFWIAVGIPTSIMAACWVLYFSGGSINMVSMFAFILTLGIIVDDTIVIGEQAWTNINQGAHTESAVLSATHKMLAPIMSSSLTTISAFFPLLFISGSIGTVIFTLPLVVICVLIASLIECFFVLPSHLLHGLEKPTRGFGQKLRKKIDGGFDYFKNNIYKPVLQFCLYSRALVLAIVFAIFSLILYLLFSGVLNFTFFPTPEGRVMTVNIQFLSGTPRSFIKQTLKDVEKAITKTELQLKKQHQLDNLVTTTFTMHNRSDVNSYKKNRGENYASIIIELTSTEQRPISGPAFKRALMKNIQMPPSVEHFSFFTPKPGPPGEDIDIQISGDSIDNLKRVSSVLSLELSKLQGVGSIHDDLPMSQEQWLFNINANGKALGFTTEDIGQQVRASFNGEIVQIFNRPNEEIEVKLMLDKKTRENLSTLEYLPVFSPKGQMMPLANVVSFSQQASHEKISHSDTRLSLHLTAIVDNKLNNANKILADLSSNQFKQLEEQYNVLIKLKGKSEEQNETFIDMYFGLFTCVAMIYIILAWVFSSYLWPFIVMLAIPLGLIGAIIGHMVMGIDLTILSMFGLFGLSGIVINDSIILLNEYRHIRDLGITCQHAIIEATAHRLRAVLLTSITTIAGLTPLLFERSEQGQFLVPMATSITFGLAFATVIILIVIPVALSLVEEAVEKLKVFKNKP